MQKIVKMSLKQLPLRATRKTKELWVKGKNRSYERLYGPFPRVFHNGEATGIGGPTVKLNRMQRHFPNDSLDYNIIYGIWQTIPVGVCQRAQARGVKVVYHVNSVYHPAYRENYKALNAIASEMYSIADYIVYGSEFAKLGAKRYLGEINTPSTVIYNAVDTTHFRPLGATCANRFHVLTTGVQSIQNKLVPLIRAMSIVKQSYPEAKLIIAGPLRAGEGLFDCGIETIQPIIDQVGLQDVEFLGSYTQEEAPGIYGKGDVLAQMKYMDWTPNTAIEAMACGLPVVHTGSGGMNELVGNAGVSLGLPSDWDNVHTPVPEKVAQGIIAAYENRQSLGKLARQTAEKQYEMQDWVKSHLRVFNRLLSA